MQEKSEFWFRLNQQHRGSTRGKKAVRDGRSRRKSRIALRVCTRVAAIAYVLQNARRSRRLLSPWRSPRISCLNSTWSWRYTLTAVTSVLRGRPTWLRPSIIPSSPLSLRTRNTNQLRNHRRLRPCIEDRSFWDLRVMWNFYLETYVC